MPANPLEIPELVERCICLLADDENMSHWHRRLNLTSCALVARSWVDAAQSWLFRAPHEINVSWDENEVLLRFHRALQNSPHLTRHVRDLLINAYMDCSITQTTLEKTSGIRTPSSSCSVSPTLRRVGINTLVDDLVFFGDVWKRCSPSIRHLELQIWFDLVYQPACDAPEPAVPIQLDSLQVAFSRSPFRNKHPAYEGPLDPEVVYPWALHPFDLSNLKALSIQDEMGVPWERFGKTVQVLDVYATAGERTIDLSSFPNLAVFRISRDWAISPMMISTLSTITSSSSIRTITIDLGYNDIYTGYNDLEEAECPELDAVLSALPMENPPTIEFEVTLESETHEMAKRCFPRLMERGMLHFVSASESFRQLVERSN
ncbi:hypothetical protein MVEN_00154700 [Mycena venus]|uniref:Uncharacterized protein n=1 Tax=Mycena venus TaxID=2733690 RepID=A0A8H6YXL4_9AGAR|nr:hypothetical protein MVEN_00154700 [Mycena venus]